MANSRAPRTSESSLSFDDSDRRRLRDLLVEHSYRTGDFTLTSGRKSSFLVDVKPTALLPEGGHLMGRAMLCLLREQFPDAVGVGGRTLGADPLAVCISQASAYHGGSLIDAFIVRKEPKGHGTGRLVEASGRLRRGAKVVVLEDTMTTGGSTLKAVEAVRQAGFDVIGVLAMIERGEGGADNIRAAGLDLAVVFEASELAPNAT